MLSGFLNIKYSNNGVSSFVTKTEDSLEERTTNEAITNISQWKIRVSVKSSTIDFV